MLQNPVLENGWAINDPKHGHVSLRPACRMASSMSLAGPLPPRPISTASDQRRVGWLADATTGSTSGLCDTSCAFVLDVPSNATRQMTWDFRCIPGRSPVGCVNSIAARQVVRVSGHASDAPALASLHGGEAVDLCATARASPNRQRASSAHRSLGTRQSAVGLSAPCGRAETPRHRRIGNHGQEDPAPGTARSCRQNLRHGASP
jgi:hypothetical protein